MSEGTDAQSAFSKHVLARLLEFTSARSPWNRRLWNVGSILALEEVYEAGRWVDGGVLSQAERVARLTASHLLDSGHSFGGLQDWLRGDLSNSSAMEILESASEMVRPEPVTWTTLIPLAAFPAEPNLTARLGARWLAPQEARQIVQDEGHEAPERLAGAFIFDVQA